MTFTSRSICTLLLAVVAGACESNAKVAPGDDLSMPLGDGGEVVEDLAPSGPVDAPPPPPPIEGDAFLALPPFVVTTSPSNAAAGVATSAPIVVQFSKAMDTASLMVTLTPSVTLGAAVWTAGDTVATLAPSAPLATSSSYAVTIVARDTAGTALDGTSTFMFTSAAPPDTTAPTITTTTPANAATGVPVASSISVKFSETMNVGSVTLTVFPALDAPIVWSENNSRLTVTGGLRSAQGYTLYVGGTDLAGNALGGTTKFFFTTADLEAPSVVYVNPPSDKSTALPRLSIKIGIRFSEPMNRTDAQKAFTLADTTDSSSPVPVTCTYGWIPDDTYFDCSATLADDRYYTMKLSNGATDKAGNKIVFPGAATFREWTFRTLAGGGTPDTTPPTITLTSPANGAQAQGAAVPIVITFSKAMDPTSVQNAFTTVPPAPIDIPFTTPRFSWNDSNTVMTFRSPWGWPYATSSANNVSWTLGTGASDTHGNALGAAASGSFRTLFRKTTRQPLVGADRWGTVWNLALQLVGRVVAGPPIHVGEFDIRQANLVCGCPTHFSFTAHGVLNFQLPPGNITRILSAHLLLSVPSVYSSPPNNVSNLGDLKVDSLNSSVLSEASYDGETTADESTGADSSMRSGEHAATVTAKVIADLGRRVAQADNIRFRLRFNDEHFASPVPVNNGWDISSESVLEISWETTDVP